MLQRRKQGQEKSYCLYLKLVFHINIIYNIFLRMINNFQQSDQDQEANIKITNLYKQSVCTYIFRYQRIYNVISQNSSYIVKVFPQHGLKEYQKERYILETLDHPNIIKPIGSSEQVVGQISNRLRHEALVFPEAKFGNFLTYLTSFRSFSERVAKFYLMKIVRALRYAKDKLGFYHENLNLENLLMKQDRDVLICGWSYSIKNSEKPLNLVIARLAIQMITQRDPFPHREIKSSPYYKFLNEKHITKFWTQMEKTINFKQKPFISEEFKKFLTLLLLNQMTSLEEIKKYLEQEQITLEELKVELQSQQQFKGSKKVSQEKP